MMMMTMLLLAKQFGIVRSRLSKLSYFKVDKNVMIIDRHNQSFALCERMNETISITFEYRLRASGVSVVDALQKWKKAE